MVDVEAILRLQSQAESDRRNFESLWRDVAERVRPTSNIFQNQIRSPGQRINQRVFDSTAALALERYASALESVISPRTQRWHKFQIPELKDNHNVQVYLDEVTDIVFNRRYNPRANFGSQAFESYMSLGLFGNQVMFIDEDPVHGLRYKSCHIGYVWFFENHQGIVDMVHRKRPWTARQIAQKFGTDKLPATVKGALEKAPEATFDVLHHVGPREDFVYGRRDFRGMPIQSCYILCEGKVVLSEGGYRSFPYAVSRCVTAPDEKYGRGPAMTIYPDIMTLNEMSKTILRAGQKTVDPPVLLTEDGLVRAFDLRAGALNYGGLNDRGEPMAKPFLNGARIDIGLEMEDQRRKVINDAFLITLFQILVETPEMTATEALIRAQEKGALLAPVMGRQQYEWQVPQIGREIDILSRRGDIPPPPDEILEMGGLMNVEFTSPLNRLQRAEDGVGILRTLDAINPVAQIDPTVLDSFDPDEMLRVLADVNGAPAKIFRTRDQVKALRENRQQQADSQRLLEAAPLIGDTVKSMTQAANQAQNTPQIQPLPAPV